MDIALIVVAMVFAVFTGINDGGALLVTSLKMDSVRPLTAAALLAVTVVVAPAIFGTQVATTLSSRLVRFSGQDQDQLALLLAVLGATVVVIVLARGGLPTSLTLALIGGILGVGVGGGLPIAWSWVIVVLLVAAAAPFAGLAAAFGVARLWRALVLPSTVARQVRHAHRFALVFQAFAYGTNDGQKMLAVFALAIPAGLDEDGVVVRAWMLVTVGALFALGTLAGVRRYGMRLGSTMGALSPVHAVTAQLSAAVAVTGSAAAGAPASMTQSITGALIGSGLTDGGSRIRWQHAARIVAAWIVTLPIAMAVVALPAALLLRSGG